MIAQRHSALSEVVQVPEFEVPEFARSKELLLPDLTFSALRQGQQSAFAASPSQSAAGALLRAALRRRPEGVVIVSTTKQHHLDFLAKIASETVA